MIDKLTELTQLIKQYPEHIVYGAGPVSKLVIRYLTIRKIDASILCVGVRRIGENYPDVLGVPVFSIDELGLFSKTAHILVCTKNEHHESIRRDLDEFGFCKYSFVDESLCDEIRNELNSMGAFDLLEYYMEENAQKIKDMLIETRETEEAIRVNRLAFEKYRNTFRGKDIAIVASGPTVNYFSDDGNKTYIGVNRAYMCNSIKLDFLFRQDAGVDRYQLDTITDEIRKLECTVFVGKYTRRAPHYINGFPEDYLSELDNIKRYFVTNSSINEDIYPDICEHPLYDCHSVVFPAIHFALFTYPKRIYLIGCDVSGTDHFYEEKHRNESEKDNLLNHYNLMKLGYIRVKRFAKQFYPETEIISVNPIGLKGLFRDEYTQEYLESVKKNSGM